MFLESGEYGDWYHGTIKKYVNDILDSGKVHPRFDGNQTSVGGYIFETMFTYWTHSDEIAKQYAYGVEAKREERESGAVFKMTPSAKSDLNILDWSEPLNKEDLEFVNSYLPDYKPIQDGEGLDRFPWRSNKPFDFVKVLRELGYNAYLQSADQLAVLGSVPVTPHKDWRNVPWPKSNKVEEKPTSYKFLEPGEDRGIQI